jgi:hypothetical protein
VKLKVAKEAREQISAHVHTGVVLVVSKRLLVTSAVLQFILAYHLDELSIEGSIFGDAIEELCLPSSFIQRQLSFFFRFNLSCMCIRYALSDV